MRYEDKLLATSADILPSPAASLPYSELLSFENVQDIEECQLKLQKLAEIVPFELSGLPSFGKYEDNRLCLMVEGLRLKIYACERGELIPKSVSDYNVDQIFYIMSMCAYPTRAAKSIVLTLDLIKDQRLIMWVAGSSRIYRMYQVNENFGGRALYQHLSWMSDELVRMGIASSKAQAIRCKRHILHGLTLGGLPLEDAEKLYGNVFLT